jgi:hypothetical protein
MKKLILLPFLLLSFSSFAGGGDGDTGGGPGITMLQRLERDIFKRLNTSKTINFSTLKASKDNGSFLLPLSRVSNVVTSEGFIDFDDIMSRTNAAITLDPIIEIPRDPSKIQSIQFINGEILFLD